MKKTNLTITRLKHLDLMDSIENKNNMTNLEQALKNAFKSVNNQCYTEQDTRFCIIYPLLCVLRRFFPERNNVGIQNEHAMGTKTMNMTNTHGTGRIDICLGPDNNSKYLRQIYLVVEAKLKSDENDYPQVVGELASSFFYNKLMALNSQDHVLANFVTYALLMDGTGRFAMFVAKQSNNEMQILYSDELSFVVWDDAKKKYESGLHFSECCQILAAIVSSADLPLLYENYVASMNAKLAEKEEIIAKLQAKVASLESSMNSSNPHVAAISLQQLKTEEISTSRKRPLEDSDKEEENPSKKIKLE